MVILPVLLPTSGISCHCDVAIADGRVQQYNEQLGMRESKDSYSEASCV
jgi:hypothetical protein